VTSIAYRASRLIERWCDYPNFIWSWHRRPCWHCGRKTSWVDLSFEAPLHPGFCEKQKDTEYFDNLKHGDLLRLVSDMYVELYHSKEMTSDIQNLLKRAEKMLTASDWPLERKTENGPF
jgi:hypothetical protein